jgi:hypothetical protein
LTSRQELGMAHTKHVTLVAATVATVALDDPSRDKVWVTNRHASVEAFATVNGDAPTVGGDDCFIIPAARTTILRVPAGAPSVKLISSGTPGISVTTVPPLAD